jgi:hypothetical protein
MHDYETSFVFITLIAANLVYKHSLIRIHKVLTQEWIIKQSMRIVLEAHIVEAVKQYIYRFCLLQQSD